MFGYTSACEICDQLLTKRMSYSLPKALGNVQCCQHLLLGEDSSKAELGMYTTLGVFQVNEWKWGCRRAFQRLRWASGCLKGGCMGRRGWFCIIVRADVSKQSLAGLKLNPLKVQPLPRGVRQSLDAVENPFIASKNDSDEV